MEEVKKACSICNCNGCEKGICGDRTCSKATHKEKHEHTADEAG